MDKLELAILSDVFATVASQILNSLMIKCLLLKAQLRYLFTGKFDSYELV